MLASLGSLTDAILQCGSNFTAKLCTAHFYGFLRGTARKQHTLCGEADFLLSAL